MSRWALLTGGLLVLCATAAGAEWVPVADLDQPLEVRVLQSDGQRTVLEYRVAGFEREAIEIDGQIHHRITLPGASGIRTAGDPALPGVRRSIAIPDDARMAIRVLEESWVDVEDVRVAPSKGPIPRNIDPTTVPYVFGDAYGGDGWSPTEAAAIDDPYILRDVRGLVVEANLLRHHPASNTLRVTTRLVVEIEVVGPGEINVLDRTSFPATLDAEFSRLYATHFANYGLSRYAPVLESGNMLIITFDDFRDAVMPLADWKNQCGIECEVVNKSEAGTTANAIKAYIQNYYDTVGVCHVILVGDAEQIPSFTYMQGASDPTYVLLAGNDSYPDALIGRISAQNVAQVATQVERIIAYETDPTSAGTDWYPRGTGIASNEGPGDDGEYDDEHMDNIRADLMGFGYVAVDQFYQPFATVADVSNALNEGRSIVNYCGHGWVGGWATPSFGTTHVNNLVNVGMLPFINSVACVNGAFTGTTCFAEAWLRATDGGEPTGAVGAYMSTINQYWEPPMCAQDEYIDLLTGQVMFTYGGAAFNSSCQMMDEYGGDGVDMYKTWHIFGDPSLLVRTHAPVSLAVTHDDAIEADAVTFEVQVAGVGGARCALSQDGLYLGAGVTDGSGLATILVQGVLPENEYITLTVTAPNSIPYTAQVYVGYLAIPDMALDPDSFDVEVPVGGHLTETLTISNPGELGSNLNFDITIDGGRWLSVSPSTGTVPQGEVLPVDVVINAAFLPEGSYFATIEISSNAGLRTVPVSLGVGGAAVDVADDALAISAVILGANQPNPFRSATSFTFALPDAGWVTLEVFDVSGRRVATPVDGAFGEGWHEATWTATHAQGGSLNPGIYFYKLTAGGATTKAQRLLIIR